MAVNLIRAHREELCQASSGTLDHMVIDVVGSLFDQILSDPRVPPQMARQIARLQLPVLRVALNDSTFFSSRRHPVRRFVNRIASLACAFDDFDDGPGKQFLARVRELVQEIVEGDFDQIELYTAKLHELESFIAQQTQGDGASRRRPAATLESKESELRIQQRYMLQLHGGADADVAAGLPARLPVAGLEPGAGAGGAPRRRRTPTAAQRFKRAGRDLVMSVQPKGSPALRKKFLMQLPQLMKDLNEGMALIGWPEAGAEGLLRQAAAGARRVAEGAAADRARPQPAGQAARGRLQHPDPGRRLAVGAPTRCPRSTAPCIEQRFTPEEAKQVGLVDESAVDWSGEVDIDLGAEPAPTPADSRPTGRSIRSSRRSTSAWTSTSTCRRTEPPEPTRGPQLMDHIQLGFAYQMHLKDEWQKVRLTYVSPGRSFFVFTRGKKHQETISMTARMLARMCETGRLRAFENAYLMERATARARKQLAALKAQQPHERQLERRPAAAPCAARRPGWPDRRGRVPAMSNAVPWSGLVRTKGRPSVTLTPCSTPRYLTGISPWSCVIATTRSNSPGCAGAWRARMNTVSGANGPLRVDALGARRRDRRRDDARSPRRRTARPRRHAGSARPPRCAARLAPARRAARGRCGSSRSTASKRHRVDRTAQRQVDRDQHRAQLVVGQHHAHRRRRAAGRGQRLQHLGVAGIGHAGRGQRLLVDRRGDDAGHLARPHQLDRALDARRRRRAGARIDRPTARATRSAGSPSAWQHRARSPAAPRSASRGVARRAPPPACPPVSAAARRITATSPSTTQPRAAPPRNSLAMISGRCRRHRPSSAPARRWQCVQAGLSMSMNWCSSPKCCATWAATRRRAEALAGMVAAGEEGHAGLARVVRLRLGDLAGDEGVGAGGDRRLEVALRAAGAPGHAPQRPAVALDHRGRTPEPVLQQRRQRRHASAAARARR